MQESFYTLPGPGNLCLALVSDLHSFPGDEALASLKKQRPELICVTGDFVLGRAPREGRKLERSPEAEAFLRACAGLAPTFVSLGNHEWMLNEADLELMHSYGVTVLDNCFASIPPGGTKVCCGGLSSARFTAYQTWRRKQSVSFLYPEPDRTVWAGKPEPCTGWLDDFERQPGYKILLCHHPEYVPRYLQNRCIDLIVSGHAHGGQWRYYSRRRQEWRGIYVPGQGLLPKLTEGIHGNHVISRGLSNNTPIPRLNNPPELVYILPANEQGSTQQESG